MKYKEYDLPDDLLYNKDSSWIKVKDNIATIGIIEPIAKILKEFVFIKLPEIKKINKGEIYVSLETLKWSGHLTSPVSGQVIEVNEGLFNDPSIINKEPYNSWIAKIEIEDSKDIDNLFRSEDLGDWLDKTIKGGKI
jgi:glycine cleavage system H protein